MINKNIQVLIIPLLLFVIVVNNGCSNTSEVDNLSEIYNCLVNESEILKTPGSSDGPKLSHAVAIETGEQSLSWTRIDGSIYYELEECSCPDFSSIIMVYEVNGFSYKPSKGMSPQYYRIRAMLVDRITGWSNVAKYPF